MRASAVVIGVSLLLAGAIAGSVPAQEGSNAADKFFQGLLVGGAEKGTIYLEVPLKATLFANARTQEEKWAVWESFFKQAIKERTPPDYESPQFRNAKTPPYWGDFIYGKIDTAHIAKSVEVRVGETLRVRTPMGMGSATILRYEIHHSVPGGSDLLLAPARPASDFKVQNTELLVAARDLPACNKPCVNRSKSPGPHILEKIREAVRKGAKLPEKRSPEQFVALQGHFTTRDRLQYVVYANFDTTFDGSNGYWRTLVLDTDMSLIAVLGENAYAHITPRSVGDINGDGLDEIWVDLHGYEGTHAAIYYWRGRSGKGAFGAIATAYHGA